MKREMKKIRGRRREYLLLKEHRGERERESQNEGKRES